MHNFSSINRGFTLTSRFQLTY